MTSPAFTAVERFEKGMAAFAGARYGVAVASCTDALFLSCKFVDARHVKFPARTYISAVAAAIHAGATVEFMDYEWSGTYTLEPYPIIDGALRMRSGMYLGGLHCVSFHARKLVPIGRGGMILTDDEEAAKWLKLARFDGRNPDTPFMDEDVQMLGWNCYMTPEQAARGLQLLENLKPDLPDLDARYPDLSKMTVFREVARKAA